MGLIDSKPYKPILLTSLGKIKATEIISKHRLIELYLVEKMNFKLDEVHEIAEEIEHIKNSKFFNRMREILGDASIDPHGSVIPDYDYQSYIMKNIYLLIILISFGLQAQEINWISFPEALEAQKKEP